VRFPSFFMNGPMVNHIGSFLRWWGHVIKPPSPRSSDFSIPVNFGDVADARPQLNALYLYGRTPQKTFPPTHHGSFLFSLPACAVVFSARDLSSSPGDERQYCSVEIGPSVPFAARLHSIAVWVVLPPVVPQEGT